MDPLSITASVIALLQITRTSGNALNKLLSLRDAPQQLQQLWNEAEALRCEYLPSHILQPDTRNTNCESRPLA